MKQKLLIGLFATCALALCATNTMAAKGKVYTWTDDKGVVHYGERPPKDSQAALVKTRSGHSDPTPIPAPAAPNGASQTTSQQDANIAAAKQLKDPDRCSIARKNLEMLNTAARIRVPGDDGNLRVLTEGDKEKKRAAMQEIIDQACE